MLLIFVSFLFSLTLTACTGSKANSDKIDSTLEQPVKNLEAHIHPDNACLGLRSHTHVGGNKPHKHSFKCESIKTNSNAHIHPAKGNYPEIRHVHANGSKKHSHY